MLGLVQWPLESADIDHNLFSPDLSGDLCQVIRTTLFYQHSHMSQLYHSLVICPYNLVYVDGVHEPSPAPLAPGSVCVDDAF